MIFAHIHSTKEKLYGLFNLHVQLDFTIGGNNFQYIKRKTIRKHVNNVFSEGEVDKDNNAQKMRVVGVKQKNVRVSKKDEEVNESIHTSKKRNPNGSGPL